MEASEQEQASAARPIGGTRRRCGIADLPGFRVNRANLKALVAGQKRIPYTRRMRARGTAGVFKSLAQNAVSTAALADMSYRDAMEVVRRVPLYGEILGLQPGSTPGATVDVGSGGSKSCGGRDGTGIGRSRRKPGARRKAGRLNHGI